MGRLLNEIIENGIFIESEQQYIEQDITIVKLTQEIKDIEYAVLQELSNSDSYTLWQNYLILLHEAHTAKEAAYCDLAFKRGICLGIELLVELLTD